MPCDCTRVLHFPLIGCSSLIDARVSAELEEQEETDLRDDAAGGVERGHTRAQW